MEDLMPKVLPALEWVREKVFMTVADIISKQFELDLMNVYTTLIFFTSLWLASKVVGNNYTSVEGRWGYLAVITAIIFYIFRFLWI